MSEKKEAIPPRPHRKSLPETPDDWVEHRNAQPKQTPPAPAFQGVKRITVEVPPDLHLKIKTYCVANGKNIADEVRAMLTDRFKD